MEVQCLVFCRYLISLQRLSVWMRKMQEDNSIIQCKSLFSIVMLILCHAAPSLFQWIIHLYPPLSVSLEAIHTGSRLTGLRLGYTNARYVQNSQRPQGILYCCFMPCLWKLLWTQLPSSVIAAPTGQIVFHGCWFDKVIVTLFPLLKSLVPGLLREVTMANSCTYQQHFP